MICVFLLAPVAHAIGDQGPWDGRWHTYWRDGEALLVLEQDGDTITGTYEPGQGSIEASVQAGELRGRWSDQTREGRFVFVLSDDGRSFAGQFGNGDYWNGERVDAVDYKIRMPLAPSYETPRDTLQSILIAANESSAGNIAAPLWFGRGLQYAGPFKDNRDLNRRRTRFLRLIDLCTFRLADIADSGEAGQVTHRVSPAGSSWGFELVFKRQADGNWSLVVPPLEAIDTLTQQALESLEFDDLNAWNLERQHSPRHALGTFVYGCSRWSEGGRDLALEIMDLSEVPGQLRAEHGEIIAEYLWQIINRVGWIVWQEIPDDPDRLVPFVFYRHAEGSIVLAPQQVGEDGVRWRLTARTIEDAPDIYRAIENLPVTHERGAPHFSNHFRLRNAIASLSPWLVQRGLTLENWQWLALIVTLAVTVGLAALAGWVIRTLTRRLLETADRRGFVGSTRLIVFSGAFLLILGELGLSGDTLGRLLLILMMLLIIGVTWLSLRLTGVIGNSLHARAERTTSQLDEIVTSLSAAVIKVVLVICALLVSGEVLGVPYEGVLAGLSIGGIAVAIAARETIANFIGAAVMLSDRPFKRGDLVELDNHLAVVESVGMRSSRLRRLDDALLTIPNGRLSDHLVVNLGRRRKRLIIMAVGLTYDTPREKIDQFVKDLREIVRAMQHADEEVLVGLKSFGESSLDFEVRASFWVSTYADQVECQHRLIAEIIDLARRMGLSFAFPTRVVHMAKAGEPGSSAATMA